MVEIIAPGSFRTPSIEPPKKPASRLPQTYVPLPFPNPAMQRDNEKQNEKQKELEKLKKYENYLRYRNYSKQGQPQNVEETQLVGYEIGLSEEDLNKLEQAARQVGLEVPESLKQKRVVKPEEKEQSMQELQKELDAFLAELNQAYEKQNYENMIMRLRGMAEAYKRRHPTSDVFINDAGFLVIIDPRVRTSVDTTKVDVDAKALEKETAQALNEDRLMKEARAEKLIEYNKKSNPYEGYNEYYKGLYALREELTESSQVRHRTHGVGDVDIDVNKILNKEQQNLAQPPKLYLDQTMTWEDIQHNNEAMSNIYTAVGMISDELGLSPGGESKGHTVKVYESTLDALGTLGAPAVTTDEDLNAEMDRVFAEADLEKPVREYLKGIPRGAIGLFTFPVDVIMMASQIDKINYIAQQEDKTVRELVKDQAKQALKDPGFYGEVMGSILASMGTSMFVKAIKPTVYEQPGGLTGYRQIVHEIQVDGDEIARAIRTEAFDYDELTRITIRKKYGLFGPKGITIEKIPQKFTATSYESLTAADNLMTTTRILDAPLGPDDIGKVKISQMASFGDDAARFAETSTRTEVGVDDIMNFLKKAQEGGKAPNEIIKTISYSTDDATKMIVTKEIYDDIAKTSIEIKNFKPDDFLGDLIKTTKKGSGAVDDVVKVLNEQQPKTPPITGSGSSGNLATVLDDIAKEVEEVQFKITPKTGERVLVPQGNVIVPPVSSAPFDVDISNDIGNLNRDIQIDLNDLSSDQEQKPRQDTRQDINTNIDINLDQEVKTIMLDVQKDQLNFDIGISESPIYETRSKTKTITTTIQDFDLDFNIRDITDETVKLDQEVRQLYDFALMEPEIPKPKPKRTKIREKPRKKFRVQPKKTKKKVKKKRKGGKEYEWAEWIGYESFLEL